MYEEALAHKRIVQTMKVSSTAKELSEVKDSVDEIISSVESTFEQAYMQKCKGFKARYA